MKFYNIFILCLMLANASCMPWIDMSDLGPGQPQAEKYFLQEKLTAEIRTALDYFGTDVSISADGETILIGAMGDDEQGNDAGAAYIYRWVDEDWVGKKLLAEAGRPDNLLGTNVALSTDGNTALLGVYENDELGTNAGAAYIYKWKNEQWVRTKLTAKNGQPGDMFGCSVAVTADGNTLLIGAHENENRKGCVYLYRWNNTGWEETRLVASDGQEEDCFGRSVALSADGGTALIGAHLADDYKGCAYVFKWNNGEWEETRLAASDGESSDLFGSDLSLSSDGQTILIGATWSDLQGYDSGAAYIFRWQNGAWVENKLLATAVNPGMGLGVSTALAADGNVALVGASDGYGKGAAYIYQWISSQWVAQKLFYPDELEPNVGDFGCSVSLTADGSVALVGAYMAEGSGSAYLFNRQVK